MYLKGYYAILSVLTQMYTNYKKSDPSTYYPLICHPTKAKYITNSDPNPSLTDIKTGGNSLCELVKDIRVGEIKDTSKIDAKEILGKQLPILFINVNTSYALTKDHYDHLVLYGWGKKNIHGFYHTTEKSTVKTKKVEFGSVTSFKAEKVLVFQSNQDSSVTCPVEDLGIHKTPFFHSTGGIVVIVVIVIVGGSLFVFDVTIITFFAREGSLTN
ncbi:MAG: hypothetical protein EZS28_045737 [Streblomastix strix]|uniref:Uncharacterized protein n=1 Tax=Streblomastix strix TaxID=222440 RepID=A0A5J4TJU4_9EUKA|nr:MAG: hypothetical protein EZS28_045737 [Streblomastix strix]